MSNNRMSTYVTTFYTSAAVKGVFNLLFPPSRLELF